MELRAMASVLSATAMSMMAGQAAAAQAVQWSGNGHWYQIVSLGNQTNRAYAVAAAASRGGALVSFGSAAENQFVTGLSSGLALSDRVWMGLSKDPDATAAADGWYWDDGTPFNYTNWYVGQPDNATTEKKAHFYSAANSAAGQWNNIDDAGSGGVAYFAAIEWSADCNNDGIVDYGQCRDGSLPDYNGNNIPDCCEQGSPCTIGDYPVEWRVADGGNGHWYEMRANSTGGGFDAVRDAALAAGGDLASVQSQAEGDRIVALLHGGGQSYWLGGFQAPKAGEPSDGWAWTDGSPWSYTNWLSGEPNDAFPGEDFLAANPDGRWNDGAQGASFPYFAVEWSADCNGDGTVDYGQILLGELEDVDSNGVPDTCESYEVPGEYPTIQAAIDAVPAGEYGLVQVAAGTRNESFSLNGKNVRVRGAAKGATIIDGTGLSTSVVRFAGGEPATAGIERLVIRNGTAGTVINPPAPVFVGGGLFGEFTAATVTDCRFEDCAAEFGAGAYIYKGTVSFTGCTFSSNDADEEGGGLFLYNCAGSVTGCSFTANRASLASPGSGTALKTVGNRIAGGTLLLQGCTVSGNTANSAASAIEHFEDAQGVPGALRISACTVTANTSPLGAGGLVVIGRQSSCVLAGGTTVCGNAQVNVDGPYLIEGSASVCDCEADFLGDGVVNAADLGVVLSAWGLANDQGTGDLNHDGLVNGADLAMLLSSWGPCS